MKIVITIVVFFFTSVFPQNYKKIEVNISNAFDKDAITTLSLDLEHSYLTKESRLQLFVDDREFLKIQNSGLSYNILIDNWKSYYNSLPVLGELEKLSIKNNSKNRHNVSGFNFGSMGGYYTFNEIVSDLDTMFQLYPDIITEKYSIGTSHEGRDIWAVKISDNPNINEDEPAVGFDALVHAREPQSMATLMYFMWYLLENYGTDPEVTYLVNNREIFCVPCFNPDGYEYNHFTDPNGGGMWRKNRRNNGGSYGVDMNRNFSYQWGYDNIGSSPDPTSNTYRGPSPFSEPEAQAVRDLAILHNYGTHFNMHAYRNAYLYPWGYINQQTPDSLIYREFGGDMSAYNGYVYGTVSEILGYQSNGTVRDWMYGEQNDKNKIFGYTVEIGSSSDGFWPNQNRIFPLAQMNIESNMYNAFVAGEYVKMLNPGFDREYFLPGDVVEMFPVLKNKGLAAAYNIDIVLSSASQFVTVNTASAFIDSIGSRGSSTLNSPLSFTISTSATLEAEIPLVLSTSLNGSLTNSDTVKLIIGMPVIFFKDSTNNPEELWTITATPSNPKWEATSTTFHSFPTSFADSKNGNYSNNATVTMTLTDALDLSESINPRLTYWTKFSIESDWDYGQVEVSTNNGVTWVPLEGIYTEPGVGSFQPNGEPLYDGTISTWVKEEINLDNYISEQFKIRFRLRTDAGVTADGWYVDDIAIFTYELPTSSNDKEPAVSRFRLDQNYPNPFNPSTNIRFSVPDQVNGEISKVSLKIYDILGEEIAVLINEEKSAGEFNVEFRVNDIELPSGVYFYRLRVGAYSETRKMVLLR